MPALSIREIEQGLLAKGFRYQDNDHRYLRFYVVGKATTIRTMLSHGSGDYGRDLMGVVKRQLRLRTPLDLVDLVRCRMSQAAYEAQLREQGIIA